MNNIKYSVITTVYNRSDCILRCMESVKVQLQWTSKIEHIIVDDGSSDNTAKIITEYAEKNPHVHLIIFQKNRGTNAARNQAISIANGLYSIILDSDDYFVNDAIRIIEKYVEIYRGFSHFCFASQDMIDKYNSNIILSNKHTYTLQFEDFLLERVKGDFIHVINTSIVRKYPFNEYLRIFEGVFFLSFYKEAKQIQFVKEIITIRERNRQDSVTREAFRSNKENINKRIKADEILVKNFSKDFEKSEEGVLILKNHKISLLENLLLLSEYSKARKLLFELREGGKVKIPLHLLAIYYLKLGNVFFILLKMYLHTKYKIFNHPIE